MEKSLPYAYTGRFETFRNRIVSDISICSPIEGNPNAIRARAIWDTGCCTTIISKRIADFLRLPLRGSRFFKTPFGGSACKPMSEADICIVLGGMKINLNVGVDDNPNSDPDCDVTLGLDFISQGDLAITHSTSGRICLSFSYPPIGCETDFTIIAPRLSQSGVMVHEEEIDESDAVESNRKNLTVIDFFQNQAKASENQQNSPGL